MSFSNAQNFTSSVPPSIDIEIVKTIALYSDIESKLKISCETFHSCHTALEQWRHRIQYFKDRFMEVKSSHASVRSAYDDLKRAHRELIAQPTMNDGTGPLTTTPLDQDLQPNLDPVLSPNSYTDPNWSNIRSDSVSSDHPPEEQCIRGTTEAQDLGAVAGRKRKRSISD